MAAIIIGAMTARSCMSPFRAKAVAPQSGRRQDGTAIALIEVGAHSSNVTDVVAHVVGNGGGIARVVFRNVCLHFSHEVGPHIGGLGVDAATNTGEERLRGCAHTEGEHGGGNGNEGCSLSCIHGVKNNKPYSDVEQSEANDNKAHHRTAAEGNLQAFIEAGTRTVGSACRSVSGCFHPEEARQTGKETAGEEGKGHPRILHFQNVGHEGEDNGEHNKDDGHDLVLLLQVSHSALSHVGCNLLHSFCSFFLPHH